MLRLIERKATRQWQRIESRSTQQRLPAGLILVPTEVWLARRFELVQREAEHGWAFGIWLGAGEGLGDVERDIHDFAAIAVEFDRYDDGKGFAIAGRLRRTLGFSGELHAFGDIFPSDFIPLKMTGYDAFEFAVNAPLALAV